MAHSIAQFVERLWLASASPRRTQLLADAGIEHEVISPGIDDGVLCPGRCPATLWVMSMAYLKARAAAGRLVSRGDCHGVVLAADTVCATSGHILGQPADEIMARQMLESMSGQAHQTITGVCLLPLRGRGRLIVRDAATVRVGVLSDAQIGRYLASGQWRGKAGAYNLAERLADGWPIVCEGDPATVMGLPMQRLPSWLRRAAQLLETAE